MLYQKIDKEISEKENWALRRQKKIPTNKKLFVLTCMDERTPIEQILGLEPGDAHVFRNSGGLVTDDAIRSAMISTHLGGTKEIVVISHTECGMMSISGELFSEDLQKEGIDLHGISINPTFPHFKLQDSDFTKWIQTFTDIDLSCEQQVKLIKDSPLIPQDIVVHGYIWEVENMKLRRPHCKMSERVNTTEEMKKIKK